MPRHLPTSFRLPPLRHLILLLCAASLLVACSLLPARECADIYGNQFFTDEIDDYALHWTSGLSYFTMIFSERSRCAVHYFQESLQHNPRHPEAHFGLFLAHSQLNEAPLALYHGLQARRLGVAKEMFPMTLRELPSPSFVTRLLSSTLSVGRPRVVHGPMLGGVTDHSVRVWVRTSREAEVRVEASPAETDGPASSDSADTSGDRDMTTVVHLDGLRANTLYSYRLWIDGELHPGSWQFKTLPPEGEPAMFSIAFGGGANYIPPNERMWTNLASHQLASFLFLGDNVYIDAPTVPAMQRYTYYRRQSRPEFRAFVSETPVFAVWDDHDFADDDSIGGPDPFSPEWKPRVWRIFQENWVNPAYGLGDGTPGVWFDFSIADVEFFLLDSRYYRSVPNEEGASMLGDRQKAWLLEELAESTATFKVIASPVPWAFEADPKFDAWSGYPEEREEIFSWIEVNKIEGVILVSADRHRSDAWIIERPSGYTLPEFESSKLTNHKTHDEMSGAIFSYNDKPSFGLVRFDTTADDPSVIYQIVSIDDEVVFEMEVRLSELSFPPRAH